MSRAAHYTDLGTGLACDADLNPVEPFCRDVSVDRFEPSVPNGIVSRYERRRRSDSSRRVTLVVSVLTALGYLTFLRPAEGLDAKAVRLTALAARPAADAFGVSGHLKMRFALPGLPVDYPIEVQGGLDQV